MFNSVYICTPQKGKRFASGGVLKNAKVAQLVEHDLAKVGVASSNLVFRSNPFHKKGFIVKSRGSTPALGTNNRSGGGTGRHAGLKILCPSKACGFDSRPEYKAPIFRGFVVTFKSCFIPTSCSLRKVEDIMSDMQKIYMKD